MVTLVGTRVSSEEDGRRAMSNLGGLSLSPSQERHQRRTWQSVIWQKKEYISTRSIQEFFLGGSMRTAYRPLVFGAQSRLSGAPAAGRDTLAGWGAGAWAETRLRTPGIPSANHQAPITAPFCRRSNRVRGAKRWFLWHYTSPTSNCREQQRHHPPGDLRGVVFFLLGRP